MATSGSPKSNSSRSGDDRPGRTSRERGSSAEREAARRRRSAGRDEETPKGSTNLDGDRSSRRGDRSSEQRRRERNAAKRRSAASSGRTASPESGDRSSRSSDAASPRSDATGSRTAGGTSAAGKTSDRSGKTAERSGKAAERSGKTAGPRGKDADPTGKTSNRSGNRRDRAGKAAAGAAAATSARRSSSARGASTGSAKGRSAKERAAGTSAERRDAQREALRRQRQAELRRQKRMRVGVISLITVVALLVAGGIGWAIYQANRPAGPLTAPTGVAADQTYYSYGAPEGSGAPVVDIYLDFMCPICGQFHQLNGPDVDAMVQNKTATVRVHVRNFLDANSTTGDYSTRAANAFAAVYAQSPDAAWAYQDLLFQNQPQEGTAGLTNAKLADLAAEAGADKAAVQQAMKDKTYVRWTDDVVEKEAKTRKSGTPAIYIDGTKFDGWDQPGGLAQAVAAAGGASPSDAGGASDGGQ